jgi:hypothetical protein
MKLLLKETFENVCRFPFLLTRFSVSPAYKETGGGEEKGSVREGGKGGGREREREKRKRGEGERRGREERERGEGERRGREEMERGERERREREERERGERERREREERERGERERREREERERGERERRGGRKAFGRAVRDTGRQAKGVGNKQRRELVCGVFVVARPMLLS